MCISFSIIVLMLLSENGLSASGGDVMAHGVTDNRKRGEILFPFLAACFKSWHARDSGMILMSPPIRRYSDCIIGDSGFLRQL